jgi:hypothetical protein
MLFSGQNNFFLFLVGFTFFILKHIPPFIADRFCSDRFVALEEPPRGRKSRTPALWFVMLESEIICLMVFETRL